MKNKQEKLNEMHELVTGILIKQLKGGEVTPQTLALAIKFLKDNEIQADIEVNAQLRLIKEATETKVEELPFNN